ncbi:MAG: hypothetical protein HKN21_17320, partial [Candidatus Eisenbacteria bacterium]|nr:hypothetical protein [Candidatus Eisenbacteria bacterium]
VLDARVSLAVSPAFAIDLGLFKAPFSAEFLTAAPSIDFVNRSQMVSALAPGRETGVAFRGDVSGIGYQLGAFNGNGRQGIMGNDDDNLLFAGRLSKRRTTSDGSWEVGAHGAFSDDPNRERTLFGADARVTNGPWLVSAEVLGGEIALDGGAATDPLGYQATAGYMITPDRHQVLVRWDALDLDDGTGNQRFVVLGYNFWPTSAFEWQVNYLIPVQWGNVGDHQVLLNFQAAF